MQTPFHSVLWTQGLVPISKYYHTYVNHPFNIRQTKKNEKLYTTRGISLSSHFILGIFAWNGFSLVLWKSCSGPEKRKSEYYVFWLHDASAETVKMICYIIMRIFLCRIVCKSGQCLTFGDSTSVSSYLEAKSLLHFLHAWTRNVAFKDQDIIIVVQLITKLFLLSGSASKRHVYTHTSKISVSGVFNMMKDMPMKFSVWLAYHITYVSLFIFSGKTIKKISSFHLSGRSHC